MNTPGRYAKLVVLVAVTCIITWYAYDLRGQSIPYLALEGREALAEEPSKETSSGGDADTDDVIERSPAVDRGNDNDAYSLGEAGGYLAGETLSAYYSHLTRRFTDPQGHGFAAEEANNYIDRLKGYDAEVVGYDNTKNGADRKIVNRDGSEIWIQDKYYKSADGSVNAAFENGEYRYMKNGKPMQLEVPADQYDDAVQLMQKKIADGQVPGVTDPAQAESLVRKGNLTYKQAVNLTKAGNLTSLKYDATQGIVSAAPVAGITFALDFLVCTNNGMPAKDAIGESAKSALVNGSAVFAGHVLSAQLMKTGLADAMTPTAESVTAWLGDDACRAIIKAAGGETANLSSAGLAKQAGKLLNSKLVFNVGFIAVLSVPDALDLFQGRMSQGQFVKNLAVVVVGMAGTEIGGIAGAAAGGAVGTYVGGHPGAVIGVKAGTILGGIAGGLIGATAADLIGDQLFKDDADEMYEIVSAKFSECCFDYVVSQKEAEALANSVNDKLNDDGLKDMFAAEDREAYARNLIEPLFEETAKKRTFENFPENEYEIRSAMLESMTGVIYIH